MTTATPALQAILLEANGLGTADLRTRLHWIEKAAAATEACVAAGDLDDDDGGSAALHLRAALGAIVKWSQGDKSPDSLVALDALVRTLMARAQLGLLRGLAGFYDQLSTLKQPHRAACLEARDALREMALAIERGEPVSSSTLQRFERARAALPAD